MKTQLKFLSIFITTVILFITSGCRTELNEEIGFSEEQRLTANSKAANLISKIVMNDGSDDDILDDSSSYTVKLPVTVRANNIQITINSTEDFDAIEEIFDLSDVINILDFVFPITLVSNDFFEISINDQDQLDELLKNAEEDDDKNIECIDFLYPLSASVFNEVSEILEQITFENDRELYLFIMDITEDDVININFPITLLSSDTSEIVINNLDDLENVIENTTEDCNENNQEEEEEGNLDEFTKVLTSQILEVQKYKDNQSNETKNYKDYTFDFSEDGTVIITLDTDNDDIITNGTWSANTRVDGGLDAVFDFGNEAPLNKLNNTWNVKKIKENRIMLDNKNDQDISKDELFFKKT